MGVGDDVIVVAESIVLGAAVGFLLGCIDGLFVERREGAAVITFWGALVGTCDKQKDKRKPNKRSATAKKARRLI